jgi:hypothetical protein
VGNAAIIQMQYHYDFELSKLPVLFLNLDISLTVPTYSKLFFIFVYFSDLSKLLLYRESKSGRGYVLFHEKVQKYEFFYFYGQRPLPRTIWGQHFVYLFFVWRQINYSYSYSTL